MRKLYSLLVVLAFLNTTFAQRVFTNYENDSRWFLNLNGGALWHTSDVQNKLNNSWGFMIGKSYNYNYGTLVSFDLRGRYLGGEWLGQDTKLSTVASSDFALNGTTNPNVNYGSDSIAFLRNFQTKQRRLALELALHANRFRERTGWDLYVFGGLGLTFWKTHTDALYSTDTSTTMYNYNQLTSFTPVSIAEFQDGTYETPLQGTSGNRYNVDWMPSLGFGIGYQLAPRFQVGFEHKTTFTQTNLWDGKDYNANSASTGVNDLYHYTGFYLKFNFKKRERNYNRPVQTTNPLPTGNSTTTSNNCLHPTVAIVEPFQNYHQVTATTVLVRADISQIQAPHQITFKQNGQFNTNFMFDAATGRFQSTIVLAPGQNSIEISATNACGRAEESRIVLFNNTINNTPVGAPPIVTYHNPPHSPYTVETSSFALSGQVLNVSSASQIQMTLNGQPFTSFYFNSQTNGITAQLPLIEGTNTVIITGTNTFGTDSKPTVLVYTRPVTRQPPVVQFVNPIANPSEVNQAQIPISASIFNIDGKPNSSVFVNGQALTQNQYTYTASNNLATFTVNLIPGANTVTVAGVNEVGRDEKTITIIYKQPVVEQPPIVTFVDPIENPTTVTSPTYNVRARVQHVANASNVSIWVNGAPTTNFTYNTSSQIAQLNVGLVNGANSITVRGTNNVGMDEKTTTIIYRIHNPILPPVVDITSPLGNPAIVHLPSTQVNATVLNVNSAQNIQVFVNNQQVGNYVYNNQNHTVVFTAALNEGMNIVRVTGSNEAGFAEDTQNILYQKLEVLPPPIVTFVNPNPSPQTVHEMTYQMQATVLNVSSQNQIQVTQNGQVVSPSLYAFNTQSKLVTFNTNLVEGTNIFEVKGTNTVGTDSKTGIVNYKRIVVACEKPTIVYNQPANSGVIVEESSYNLEVTINHVVDANQIETRINGNLVTGLNFNPTTKKLMGQITLSEGYNSIHILAQNDCGGTRGHTLLSYIPVAAPCFTPQLTVVSPIGSKFQTDDSDFTFSIATEFVSNASEITVAIDGISYPFNFDVASHILTATVPLTLGINSIVISATTECGTTTSQINVELVKCDDPILNLSHNASANNTTTNPQFVITGNIQHVSTSDFVSVQHNGQNVSFVYNEQTDAFSCAINLIEGNNTITVKGMNNCGLDQKTFVIIYRPVAQVKPPVVTITNPENSPYHSEVESMTVTADILNIVTASQIVVTVNGTSIPFAYNTTTKEVQFTHNWIEGNNIVQVTASNSAGTASDVATIIYRKPVQINPPVVNYTNPVNNPHSIPSNASNEYVVTGFVSNISAINQVQVVVNNQSFSQFNPTLENGQLNYSIPLTFDNVHSSYTIQVTGTNPAGTDQGVRQIVKSFVTIGTAGGCMPVVGATFTTNYLTTTVTSTKDLSNVVLKFNDNTTQKFDNLSGYTASFSGINEAHGKCIVGVWIKSGCNSSTDGPGYGEWVPNSTFNGVCGTVQPCGPRFNPGNAEWQFCLVTPQGTFTRNDIHNNPNFSYTGPATSAYFMPIAGGGSATVNGAPYPVQNGRYYLFTGTLNVDVRNNHPGAMGHWQICIEADKLPASGVGNNRPVSPCSGTTTTGGTITGGTTTGGSVTGGTITTGGTTTTTGGTTTTNACMPLVGATFTANHLSTTVTSTKDLSNVVLKFNDNSTQKFDNLNGFMQTFIGVNEAHGKCIVGVWIKSGCNSSTDGPGYGEWVPNTNFTGDCASTMPCGPRFNPGNASAEFCLVTPQGTFTRDDIQNNPNFSYSGPASSVYFMPIAGGGKARVNGREITTLSGRYYLFTGNITVDVRNNHPGAMGHWQICIDADKQPTSGVGNNRPVSPCRATKPVAKPATTPTTRPTTTPTTRPTITPKPTTPTVNDTPTTRPTTTLPTTSGRGTTTSTNEETPTVTTRPTTTGRTRP